MKVENSLRLAVLGIFVVACIEEYGLLAISIFILYPFFEVLYFIDKAFEVNTKEEEPIKRNHKKVYYEDFRTKYYEEYIIQPQQD